MLLFCIVPPWCWLCVLFRVFFALLGAVCLVLLPLGVCVWTVACPFSPELLLLVFVILLLLFLPLTLQPGFLLL